jgi:hypothetical protein
MSVEKINLRKVLQLIYADARHQRALLLKDISQDRRAQTRDSDSGGGDFYGPFWADVKDHAAGRSDLVEMTKVRIDANKSRKRLYPMLCESFLSMWAEKMRWRNEPFEFVPKSVKARLKIDSLNATIKIENMAAIKTWDASYRVIYPYFSEAPALPNEGARLGFWVLKEALPDYDMNDFRIVDMLRRAYFRPQDIRMEGNEGELFLAKYQALLNLWRKLRDER